MKSLKTLRYTTPAANERTLARQWYTVDAQNHPVGRLASIIANLLSGKKHNPSYTPHVACGDYVIVLNAAKATFTGKKEKKKTYIRHTGYPGGQKTSTPAQLRAKDPTQILRRSVQGMLMKNKLGRKLRHHLFIYAGSQHPHQAQEPQEITITP